MGPLTYPRGILHRQTHLMVCNGLISSTNCSHVSYLKIIRAFEDISFLGCFPHPTPTMNSKLIPVFCIILDTSCVRAVLILEIIKYISKCLNKYIVVGKTNIFNKCQIERTLPPKL